LRKTKFLIDINVLIALTDEGHVHHTMARDWFDTSGNRDWGVCAFTEAGFLRVAANPRIGSLSVQEASWALDKLSERAGYRFWPMVKGWSALVEPFRERVHGHQQITDAYLLGLAVAEGGVLVTLDKAIRYLAGTQYSGNLLVLE
jgi:uncharacterized protein